MMVPRHETIPKTPNATFTLSVFGPLGLAVESKALDPSLISGSSSLLLLLLISRFGDEGACRAASM